MSLSPARRCALRVLKRVRMRDAWVRETLTADLAAHELEPQESALASRLVLGVAAMQGTLDSVLDRFLAKPRDVEPVVRDALRLAAYEILFMSTPNHAAVDQGVQAVRFARPRASGLANAVLRRLSLNADQFPWGDPETDDEALATLTGHPLWLVQRLKKDLGHERARIMLDADNTPPPLHVMLNPFKGDLETALAALREDGAEPTLCDPVGCILIGSHVNAVRGSALADGLVLVADRGAQIAASVMPARTGGLILDVAAGRGTKTVALQAKALREGGAASVIATDLHDFKVDILRKRMNDLLVPGVEAVVADAARPEILKSVVGEREVDAVLVDAPCSGLGTLRRHPEKRWRLKPEDIDGLASLGSEMLEASARVVRSGGSVVYSTCTVTRQENDQVIDSFLARHGEEFRLVDVSDLVPEDLRRFITQEGWFQSISEEGGPDGHFVARIERV